MAIARIEHALEGLDKSMRLLRSSLRGIPIREGSFGKQHDNLARDVAFLLVELDTVRGLIR
ncbi:MAG: hypothetical protein ACRDRD_07795 [Pseudonocardiaceae bacterium]